MTFDQEYVELPIADLVELPDNPRDGDMEVLDESMKELGFYGAVIVDRETSVVLAGNHRLRAAEANGYTTVPVILVDGSEGRGDKIALVDNRSNDKAGYKLHSLLTRLQARRDDLIGTGYTSADVDDLLASVTAPPPLPGDEPGERPERDEVNAFTDDATSDDYYTPAWLFDQMDIEFDLDVASPPKPLPWIPAKKRYTEEDDGLTSPWEGLVWMNPPYSEASKWMRKWLDHGNGIALVPVSNARWMREAWSRDDIGWAVTPAIRFLGGAIQFATVLLAIGDEAIEAIGRINTVRGVQTHPEYAVDTSRMTHDDPEPDYASEPWEAPIYRP